MSRFEEVKLFQVNPLKINEFETLLVEMKEQQKNVTGTISIDYMKRFFTFDNGHVRELTKIVKCVKYYSCWVFDSLESYDKAINWFFENYYKKVARLLIAPFDIYSGYILE